jgi:hypothetical protein
MPAADRASMDDLPEEPGFGSAMNRRRHPSGFESGIQPGPCLAREGKIWT